MKIPSIKYVSDEAFKSAKRFPLTLLCASIGVGIAIYLIEQEDNIDDSFPLVNLLLVSALGLALFFCISVYKEKIKDSGWPLWLMNVIGAALLGLVYFSLPTSEDTDNLRQPYIRYAIYNVVVHLLVSFAPFISRNEVNGFWQYNKMLFLRFSLSILYSGFVYIGLTLALVSINLLFDVDIEDETFFELFIVVLGIFNTWFFVSGVSTKIHELENKTEYPNGLKIFTQYVLLPLLILYLIILYAYVIKIFWLWDWPEGIVSYLITCVAVLGIFAFFLIYPFGKEKEHHWISKFSKVYYYTLVPLTIVLFIAIGIRINDYGFTVNRYIIGELGVWLAFISLYFIFGKKNIKMIPISLSVIMLVTTFGPWGMFEISEKSQIARLQSLLSANKILVDGGIVNEPSLRLGKDSVFFLDAKHQNQTLLTDSLQNEVYSILNYLDDYHGFNAMDRWYKQDPDSIFRTLKDSSNSYQYAGQPRVRMELMGLDYRYNHNRSSSNLKYKAYNTKSDLWRIMKTTGYDYVLTISYYQNSNLKQDKTFAFDNDVFYFSNKGPLMFNLEKQTTSSLDFDMAPMLKRLNEKYKDKRSPIVEETELQLNASSQEMSAKLQLERINTRSADSLTIESFMGKIYVKLH